MKFIASNGSVRLVSMRSFKSKNGKDLTFCKVADTVTYDTCEFLLSRDCDVKNLVPGTDYSVEIDVDGRYVTINFLF